MLELPHISSSVRNRPCKRKPYVPKPCELLCLIHVVELLDERTVDGVLDNLAEFRFHYINQFVVHTRLFDFRSHFPQNLLHILLPFSKHPLHHGISQMGVGWELDITAFWRVL